MNRLLAFSLLMVCISAQAQPANQAEHDRIRSERASLEAGFSRDESACYKRFLVNSCLEDAQLKQRDALADLRRQETILNNQERKAKGAEQVKRTEEKDSLAKQQQAADKRADALKGFDERMARGQLKNAEQTAQKTNEKAKLNAAAARLKSAQDKQFNRVSKQAAAAAETKKYSERIEKVQQKQAKLASEKATRTKPAANSLPLPN